MLNELIAEWTALRDCPGDTGLESKLQHMDGLALSLCGAPAPDLQAVLHKLDVLSHYASENGADPYPGGRLGTMLAGIRTDVAAFARRG